MILDAVRTTLSSCVLSKAVVLPYHTETEKTRTTLSTVAIASLDTPNLFSRRRK